MNARPVSQAAEAVADRTSRIYDLAGALVLLSDQDSGTREARAVATLARELESLADDAAMLAAELHEHFQDRNRKEAA